MNLAVTTERPRIVVGMPHNGVVYPEAMKAFQNWPGNPRNLTILPTIEGRSGALAHSFNLLLAEALDSRDAGQATHFAMIHSDIVPEPWWVDKLWSEMWKLQADVMATTIMIKDHVRGRTSLAIGTRADWWHVRRNLYMHELENLPLTFGSEAVCGEDEVLLINTGLWLADLRRPWWDNFAFQQSNRIVPGGREDGKRRADCRTEDYDLSRMLDAAGARYMTTRKVVARHHGNDYWGNDESGSGRMAGDPGLADASRGFGPSEARGGQDGSGAGELLRSVNGLHGPSTGAADCGG